VAFDASAVTAALAGWRGRGPRVERASRAELAPGALAVSAVESNVVDPAAVAAALRLLAGELLPARRACLILPDGVARLCVIEPPGGSDPVAFALFRLGQALPYPAAEAVVDVMRVGSRRYVAGAVRRSVVEGYEAVAAQAGWIQDRVEVAPLAALAGLLRTPGPGVDLILGDAAVSLAGYDAQGGLRVLRSRLRDPGVDELERLGGEVDRTAALASDAAPPRLRVLGAGAAGIARGLAAAGCPAQAGWSAAADGLSADAAELGWLGAAAG